MKNHLEKTVDFLVVVVAAVLACAFVVASLYALGFLIALV